MNLPLLLFYQGTQEEIEFSIPIEPHTPEYENGIEQGNESAGGRDPGIV